MRYVSGYLLIIGSAGLFTGCQIQLIHPPVSQSSLQVLIKGAASTRASVCTAYAVSASDASGNLLSVSTATTVALSNAGSGAFYSNSTCTAGISSATIAAGQSSSTIYFKDPVVESPLLAASASGYSDGNLSIAVGPGSASGLSLTGPGSLGAGSCSSAFTITSFDAAGNISAPTMAKTLLLTGAGAGRFYSDPACSSSVTQVTLAAGASSASFYFKDPSVESLLFSASASGFSNGTLSVTITQAPPAKLALSGPSNIQTSTCSGPYSATTQDASGNTVTVAATTAVSLSGGGAGVFYSDSGCTLSATSVSIASGASTQTFYFKDASIQTLTLSAAATGLTTGTLAVSVAATAPTQLTVSGPATVNTGYCSTSAYVVSVKDGGGVLFTVNAPVTVTLSGGNGARFFTDSSCATAPVTQATVGTGSSQVSVYMKDNIGETLTLTAASSGLTSGTQSVTTSAVQNRIDLFAGALSNIGYRDGTGTGARFNRPNGITTDGTNLYVLDQGNSTIRKIVISTGAVTLLAGSVGQPGSADGTGSAAQFNNPQGITTDGTNLYIADNGSSTIRKIVIATGAVTTLAGSPGVFGSSNGTGAAASFNYPSDVVYVGGNLYVTDTSNQTIRKIVASTGAVTTFAGTAGLSGSANGLGSAARFYNPYGITSDGTNLYVADYSNFVIRKIVIATAQVTTLAGSYGRADGVGSAAGFNGPAYLTYSGGALYITDDYNNGVRKLDLSTNTVSTLAGNNGSAGYGDGTGLGAYFNYPWGITTDGSGNLYVADQYNAAIRKIVISSGVVTTPFSVLPSWGTADGTGTGAQFYNPDEITSDGQFLYTADQTNDTIRKISIATGAVTTLAGSPLVYGSTNGTGVGALFNQPTGITYQGGNLYVADRGNCTIRKIVVATAAVSTLAGSPGLCASVDGTGAAARFNLPYAITNDGTNLYVTDTGNFTVRKIVIATGAVTTLAGNPGVSGWTDGTGTGAGFATLGGIVTDGTNLYVADRGNCEIRQVVIASRAVTTIAGSSTCSVTDGTGAAAGFYSLWGLAINGSVVYAADSGTLRAINVNTAVVTTLAGAGYLDEDDDGLLTAPAHVSVPVGLVSNSSGIFITNISGVRWLH